MKLGSFLAGLAVAAVAAAGVALALSRRRAFWDRQMRESAKTFDRSPYSDMIADQLKEHEGEDTPLRHAFEDALEIETRLEQQLARETGLKN